MADIGSATPNLRGGRAVLQRWFAPAVGGLLAAIVAFSSVLAANPSYFHDTFNGCDWTGNTRILSSAGQAWTFDDNLSCLDYCYLYGQWINYSGTYYTYAVGWDYCNHYAQYSNFSQTELYGEHKVQLDGYPSSLRSTDAYCGGSPC